MRVTRLVPVGVLALVLGLALAVVLTRPPRDYPQTRRLPDGSYLELVSVGHGTNHVLALPAQRPWKAFLLDHLPRSWTARLGWWAGGGSVGVSHSPGEDALAVFTVCELARSGSFSLAPRVSLCDERGVVCDSAEENAVAACFDGKRDWKLVGWKLSRVPRNSRRLRLRFSELAADGKTRRAVAEFLVSNPLYPGQGK